MTKTWNDSPTSVAPRSTEDMLLTALKDGPVPPRTVRAILTACGVSQEDADIAIRELIRQGRIYKMLEYNLVLV